MESPRERYRAQVRAEIKDHAWEQIAASGASALSLNAIAKKMGLSGPALYRYFANRDELITALVVDAYRMEADALRHATERTGNEPHFLADALRQWALANPHRYFLLHGTPIPGYHAPPETTKIAAEIMAMLIKAFKHCDTGRRTPFDVHLEEHSDWVTERAVPRGVPRLALAFWTRMHGAISLELAGHFNGMGFDPAELFKAEVNALIPIRPPSDTL
ncbi:TetR/AcrR family transcriptional regulator [Amycolatopsis sp. GM8]|uniref:TetR/AcrR family transcriptional regulator n=1 Tax=Amycolatopsis sp. GM8 TaxID=2896530 RepID=UPI001F2677D4|nr:TetR/AcrR family transcriptional regulator [Amycolatopsis sp. GM8]